MSKEQSTIPVPTYLLEDEELIAMHAKLQEIEQEAIEDDPERETCPRAAACVSAIKAELEWRGRPFTLNDDGTISH